MEMQKTGIILVVFLIILLTGFTISSDTTDQNNKSFKEYDMCPEMVVIPPGIFIMGSPETEKYRENDEGSDK